MEHPDFQEVEKAQTFLKDLRWQYWTEHVLFSPQWWLLLGSCLLATALWIYWVDRRRITEILLYGLLIFSVVMFLDIFGSEFNLWDYPYMVLPWGSRIVTIDWIIAVGFMFVYQLFRDGWLFFAGAAVLSALFAFILEPLAVWMDIYRPEEWQFYYSFPVYLLMAWLLRQLIVFVKTVEERS